MKKKFAVILCAVLAAVLVLAGCGRDKAADGDGPNGSGDAPLPDGVYSALFKTDSSMFRVNDVYKGKGTLTVKDGRMTIHVTLLSKNTVNLFPGTKEQASAKGAKLLEPTTDVVTYEDGETEEVYGFDIPVPYLDKEFDCALIGTKGVWYDHKVSVTEAVRIVEDGQYTMDVTLTGGTGKASVSSPATVTVKDGAYTAEIIWSSSHYEYMTVDGVQYDPVNEEGNSTFMIPIVPDKDIAVQALTTAMSEPHLIEYVLHFDSATLTKK